MLCYRLAFLFIAILRDGKLKKIKIDTGLIPSIIRP